MRTLVLDARADPVGLGDAAPMVQAASEQGLLLWLGAAGGRGPNGITWPAAVEQAAAWLAGPGTRRQGWLCLFLVELYPQATAPKMRPSRLLEQLGEATRGFFAPLRSEFGLAPNQCICIALDRYSNLAECADQAVAEARDLDARGYSGRREQDNGLLISQAQLDALDAIWNPQAAPELTAHLSFAEQDPQARVWLEENLERTAELIEQQVSALADRIERDWLGGDQGDYSAAELRRLAAEASNRLHQLVRESNQLQSLIDNGVFCLRPGRLIADLLAERFSLHAWLARNPRTLVVRLRRPASATGSDQFERLELAMLALGLMGMPFEWREQLTQGSGERPLRLEFALDDAACGVLAARLHRQFAQRAERAGGAPSEHVTIIDGEALDSCRAAIPLAWDPLHGLPRGIVRRPPPVEQAQWDGWLNQAAVAIERQGFDRIKHREEEIRANWARRTPRHRERRLAGAEDRRQLARELERQERDLAQEAAELTAIRLPHIPRDWRAQLQHASAGPYLDRRGRLPSARQLAWFSGLIAGLCVLAALIPLKASPSSASDGQRALAVLAGLGAFGGCCTLGALFAWRGMRRQARRIRLAAEAPVHRLRRDLSALAQGRRRQLEALCRAWQRRRWCAEAARALAGDEQRRAVRSVRRRADQEQAARARHLAEHLGAPVLPAEPPRADALQWPQIFRRCLEDLPRRGEPRVRIPGWEADWHDAGAPQAAHSWVPAPGEVTPVPLAILPIDVMAFHRDPIFDTR